MKPVGVIMLLFTLKAGAQMAPLDQALADQQLAEKKMQAEELITKQQAEALARQKSIEQQNVGLQIQALQAQGMSKQPESPPANPPGVVLPQTPAQNDLPLVDLKIPQGPIKAGPYTQQSIGVNNSKELEQKISGRVKDPFMLPNHLYLKIKRKLGDVQGEGYIDESVEPQRRWALKRYKLVAIIWNVKRPKAMITDAKADLHMFYLNDRIGNSEGVISSISNGEVTVNEKGTESKLRMAK